MSKDAHYTNEKNALERMLEIGSGVNDYREYAGNKVKDVLEQVKKAIHIGLQIRKNHYQKFIIQLFKITHWKKKEKNY